MNSIPEGKPRTFYQDLPKVELHRHLEGSLRMSTMLEIARVYDLDLPHDDLPRFRQLFQVSPNDTINNTNFLLKFSNLRKLYRSAEIIQRITQEAIADAAAENIKYMELRFTPYALSSACNFDISDVMEWVIEGVNLGSEKFGLQTQLIASVNRHESLEIAEQVARSAVDLKEHGICGFDLAGNESDFPARPFLPLFKECKQDGLHISVHAGEWADGRNVREAMELFDAERIGHGVRILEDPEAVTIAKERMTTLEVCITSNLHSGVVAKYEDHPLPDLLREELDVTINTDDPGISQITLTDEYQLVCETFSIPIDTLVEVVITAAEATYLPEPDRQEFVSTLKTAFSEILTASLGD